MSAAIRAAIRRPFAELRRPADAAGEQLRASRRLTRQAAIEVVAADPAALNTALLAARRVLVSPTHRASSWGEVAGTVKRLAAAIPDDIG